MFDCFARFWRRHAPQCCCGGAAGEVGSGLGGESAVSGSEPFVEIEILRKDVNTARKFPGNHIRTAKYTRLNCIPCSLLSQFRKVSNVFFLAVMILSLIPGTSPVNPFSCVLPFCIVLGAGISKDIWEDRKRYQSDSRANGMKVLVLRGDDFVNIPSCDVCVGDVMLYKLGDEVVADAVLLNTSLSDGVAYIETVSLDGETNAKMRRAKPETVARLGTVEDIIENCLPDVAMRKYFRVNGTTAGWGKPTPAEVAKPAHAPMATLEHMEEDSYGKKSKNSPLHSSGFHNNNAANARGGQLQRMLDVNCRDPLVVGNSESRLSHARSRTFAASDGVGITANTCHRRQLTFDERFAVGRELPMPSDILEMTRVYEQRQKYRFARSMTSVLLDQEKIDLAGTFPSGGGSEGNVGKLALEGAESSCTSGSGVVVLGAPPCPELYSWIGQLRIRGGEAVPLDVEQLLPRGCVIRNTEWVLCTVVYTGKDTKLLLNMRPRRKKVSVIEQRANYITFFLVLLHQALVLILCIFALLWRNRHLGTPEEIKSGFNTWYVRWNLERHTAPYFFSMCYLTNFVLLSSLIPISLYVMLEFNKAMQMVLIARDKRMANYDEFSGELRYSRPKNSELNSQLARVQYIFTDKTGTLTENLMTYVGGCAGTDKHNEQERPGGLGEAFLELVQHHSKSSIGGSSPAPKAFPLFQGEQRQRLDFDEVRMESEPLYQYLRALSLCHSVVCFNRADLKRTVCTWPLNPSPNGAPALDASISNTRTFDSALYEPFAHEKQGSFLGATVSSFNANVGGGVGKLLHGRTGSASWYLTRHDDMMTHQRHATMSHQVSRLRDDSKIYEGQSLDEIALVTAARNNLFALQKRSAKHMFVKVVDKLLCYEIVAELEFTSQRKLMSVLLCRSPMYDQTDVSLDRTTSNSYRRPTGVTSDELPELQTLSEFRQRAVINPTVTQRGEQIPAKDALHMQEHILGVACDDVKESGCTETGRQYLLLVKGADNSMMSIINKRNTRNTKLAPFFQRELERMGREGLRTLVLGQRYLSEREVCCWMPDFHEARCSMHYRSEKLHKVYALIEKDIDLIGTTAVEDQLQEGVRETLEFFLQAEIVVWVLTGDKRETAVTIAVTSSIIDRDFEDYVFHLDVASALTLSTPSVDDTDMLPVETIQAQMDAIAESCAKASALYDDKRVVVMVIDGSTLDVVFSDEGCTRKFLELGMRCRSAICCRMTPMQKAKVVRLFQKNTNAVALAVGDGANDASMILESRIGVGIMGLEGSQAELASDYAIPKFRFLKRLMMVHGRFSLYRDAHCILFSLYKNIFFTLGTFAYTLYSNFSGVLLVDSWLLAMFNLFFCSLQPLVIGVLEKDVEDELAESLPSLYPALGRAEMFFSWPYILKWLLDGVIDGISLFFFLVYAVAPRDALYPYRSATIEDYGMLFFILMLVMLNLRVFSLLTCYTVVTVAVLIFCFVAIPLFTILYSALPSLLNSNWCVLIAMELMGMGKFYLFVLLMCGLFVVYGLGVNVYIMLFYPWTNGGHAMRAAWRSKYRHAHHERLKQLH